MLALLGAAALLAGCATSTATLLADHSGAVGAVAVLDAETGAERGVLTGANTQASLRGREINPRTIDPARYAELMAGLPDAPRSYLLYFVEGATDLTEESQPTLAELRRVVTPETEVQITGHTDTVGSMVSNDQLSFDRALQVRALLVKQGLPVENAKVTGRGERDLRVRTADGVSEGANRRVEVIVR